MNILVLGGTRFLGRAIVEHALARGHDVTLFNRGTHGELFPETLRITGDRGAGAVDGLTGTSWDCVVDVSAYRPAEVRPVLRALGGRFEHYLYISTVSVYASPAPGADESAPLLEVDEEVAPSDPDSYGGLKARCEHLLRDAAADRLAVLRPTVVIGPHDYTDRFGWWVRRVAAGGRLEVPRRLDQPVQLIDADDLGLFAVRVLEERLSGAFNVVGPQRPLTLSGLIQLLGGELGTTPELVPVDAAAAETVPLTLPEDGSEDGSFSVSGARAWSAGLGTRPLAQSARAVLDAQHERAQRR